MSEQTQTLAVANMADDVALDTADLHIVRPGTNTKTGWVITCAGPGHPQTIELNNKNQRENLRKAKQIELAQVNGRKWKGDDEEETPEESRRNTVADVCRRIVTWTPVDFGDGPITFSHENAVNLFMDPKKGVYFGQLVDFLTAERTFFKRSVKT